jgi:hypothetical protein
MPPLLYTLDPLPHSPCKYGPDSLKGNRVRNVSRPRRPRHFLLNAAAQASTQPVDAAAQASKKPLYSIKVKNNLKNRYETLGKIPEFTEAIRGWVAQMNEIDPTPGTTGNPRAPASNLDNIQNMYKPDNIGKGEYEMYKWLRNHPENLQMQDADKGGYIVIISQQMAEDLAEVHTKSPAYEIANMMIAKQGTDHPYAGAGGRSWPSTANFIPNLTPQGEMKGNLELTKMLLTLYPCVLNTN